MVSFFVGARQMSRYVAESGTKNWIRGWRMIKSDWEKTFALEIMETAEGGDWRGARWDGFYWSASTSRAPVLSS